MAAGAVADSRLHRALGADDVAAGAAAGRAGARRPGRRCVGALVDLSLGRAGAGQRPKPVLYGDDVLPGRRLADVAQHCVAEHCAVGGVQAFWQRRGGLRADVHRHFCLQRLRHVPLRLVCPRLVCPRLVQQRFSGCARAGLSRWAGGCLLAPPHVADGPPQHDHPGRHSAGLSLPAPHAGDGQAAPGAVGRLLGGLHRHRALADVDRRLLCAGALCTVRAFSGGALPTGDAATSCWQLPARLRWR